MFWGGVKLWKWAAGGGPPALNPDTAKIEPLGFLTATVTQDESKQFGQKLKRYAKAVWFWIY